MSANLIFQNPLPAFSRRLDPQARRMTSCLQPIERTPNPPPHPLKWETGRGGGGRSDGRRGATSHPATSHDRAGTAHASHSVRPLSGNESGSSVVGGGGDGGVGLMGDADAGTQECKMNLYGGIVLPNYYLSLIDELPLLCGCSFQMQTYPTAPDGL